MVRAHWRRVVRGAVLIGLAVVIAGTLLPNRTPVPFRVWWSKTWVVPAWGLVVIGLATGACIAGAGMGLAWYRERRRSASAESRRRAIEAEVNELRRLLVRAERPAPATALAGRG